MWWRWSRHWNKLGVQNRKCSDLNRTLAVGRGPSTSYFSDPKPKHFWLCLWTLQPGSSMPEYDSMWNRCKTWHFLQWRSSWVASKKGPFSGQSRAPCSTTMMNLHPLRPNRPCTHRQQALEFANDTLAESFARNTLISCSRDHLRSART